MANHIPAKFITRLNQQARQNYIQTVYEYLEEFFPGTHDYFEQKQIIDTIELGIEKAESYDIRGKNDVCSFICLMFTFLGSHFDVDPLYPWTQNILSTKKESRAPTLTATEKVELLWQKQQKINETLFHSNSQYLGRLIQTLRSQELLQPVNDISIPLQQLIHKRLAAYYPEKYQLFAHNHIDNLIDEGINLCRNYNINKDNEICWYISLMFIFGSRFDIDPKYPILEYLQQKSSLQDGELILYLKPMIKHYLKSKIQSIRQLAHNQKEIA